MRFCGEGAKKVIYTFILTGFLSGSILFGYFVTWQLKHVDIREISEDENPGTYNAFVHGGFICGFLTLLGDLLKGYLPVALCRNILGMQSPLFSLVMAAPVFGHGFSVFHGTRGGKGIAVSFGVFLGLLPLWQPVALLAFFYLLFSLAFPVKSHRKRSIITFLCFLGSCVLMIKEQSVVMGSVLISVIVIYKHHTEQKKSRRLQSREYNIRKR